MWVIDLKVLIFVILLLVGVVGGVVWWLSSQRSLFDQRTQAVWQVAPFGVLIVGAKRLHFSNQQAQRLLQLGGFTTEQLQQQFKPDVTTQHFNLNSAETTLEAWSGIFGRIRLIILRDISHQRREAREMQRFWGGVSHELRTPLTSILSHLEVARSQKISPEVRQHSLDISFQQAQRLTNLIQNTLELGRLRALEMTDKTVIDLVLVAEEAIAELILLAEEQEIHFTLSCDSALPHVLGSPDKLKQVFINLLDNTLKYGQAGDDVTISLVALETVIECCVADNGRGISAEHLPSITQQFYRGSRDVIGSGLGLAIVEEIVHQHGGELTIISHTENSEIEGAEKGTRVLFTIPRTP